jgi:hypothetical protein
MLVIIIMLTLSLNVFICLNACGLYNACMSYVKGVYKLVTENDKSLGNKKVCYNWYQSQGFDTEPRWAS